MAETDVKCPICGSNLCADYVDIGVGTEKVSPYWCERCTYVEAGCASDECSTTRCASWDICGGRSKLFDIIRDLKGRIDAVLDDYDAFRKAKPWTGPKMLDFISKAVTTLKGTDDTFKG